MTLSRRTIGIGGMGGTRVISIAIVEPIPRAAYPGCNPGPLSRPLFKESTPLRRQLKAAEVLKVIHINTLAGKALQLLQGRIAFLDCETAGPINPCIINGLILKVT
jgi:hypothetical protein